MTASPQRSTAAGSPGPNRTAETEDLPEGLAFVVGLLPAVLGGLSGAGLLQPLWRRLRDVVFPAVEIAATTPGRRMARLSLRVVSLAAAPLLGALIKSLIDAA